jgi:site-specific DNA recombinase
MEGKMTTQVSTKNKRAVLYARVSSDDQKDRGYSLPSQLDAMREYAGTRFILVGNKYYKKLDGKLVLTSAGDPDAIPACVEDFTGAVPIAERPEGKNLAAMVKARNVDAVIVYQVDRLSRDVVDLLATIRMWLQTGIEVYSLDVGKIESELDIVLVIKGWQGSDERKKIIERTSRGRYAKARSGKVVGNGWGLYGYRYITEPDPFSRRERVVGFIIHEPEAKVVRIIYRWYSFGDENGGKPLPLHSIAKRLSDLGIPCPGERARLHRIRESGMWNPVTVRNILTHEAYGGVWHYGRFVNDEPIAVNIPPIIDRETWETAQRRRDHNKRMSKRNRKHDYLLGGFIRCGCGSAMTGERGGKSNWFYYRCSHARRRFSNLEKIHCRERMARQDIIEQLVWNHIQQIITGNLDFEQALQNAQAQELANQDPKREELATVLEMIRETEAEAASLASALTKTSGGAVGKALEEKIVVLEKRYTLQIAKRDELQAALNKRTFTGENIATVIRFRENLRIGLENPTLEDKRRAFELMQLEVIVKDHRAHVKCILPAEPDVFELKHSRTNSSHSRQSTVNSQQ